MASFGDDENILKLDHGDWLPSSVDVLNAIFLYILNGNTWNK